MYQRPRQRLYIIQDLSLGTGLEFLEAQIIGYQEEIV